MHIAGVARDEQPVAHESRLGARGRDVDKAEGPLQLQLWQVLGGEPAIGSEAGIA